MTRKIFCPGTSWYFTSRKWYRILIPVLHNRHAVFAASVRLFLERQNIPPSECIIKCIAVFIFESRRRFSVRYVPYDSGYISDNTEALELMSFCHLRRRSRASWRKILWCHWKQDEKRHQKGTYCRKGIPVLQHLVWRLRQRISDSPWRRENFLYDNYYKQRFSPLMERLRMDHTPHCCRYTRSSLMHKAEIRDSIRKKIMSRSQDLLNNTYTQLDIDELVNAINLLWFSGADILYKRDFHLGAAGSVLIVTSIRSLENQLLFNCMKKDVYCFHNIHLRNYIFISAEVC